MCFSRERIGRVRQAPSFTNPYYPGPIYVSILNVSRFRGSPSVPTPSQKTFGEIEPLLYIGELRPHRVHFVQNGILAFLQHANPLIRNPTPASDTVRDGPTDGRHGKEKDRSPTEDECDREYAFYVHCTVR